MLLHSYSYSNCPFTMAKFSQYELAMSSSSGNTLRAEMALNLSNEHKAYDRVYNALENSAFDNRTIVLEGDSLTRQLFISLSCLAWSAGHVKSYDLHSNLETYTKDDKNEILINANYIASNKFIGSSHVQLKGSNNGNGHIYII